MSQKQLLLGIDLGTTNVKVSVVTGGGEILGLSTRPLGLINTEPGWVEQDSRQWWESTVDCIREILTNVALPAGNIGGIGVSGQGTGATPVDTHGVALRHSIIWMDRRSEVIARRLSIHRDRVFELSGNDIDPVYNSLAMIWIKENEPKLFEATHKYLTATEFINHRLTGEFAANDSDGGNEISYDMSRRDWSEDLAEIYGIPVGMMPKIHECTDIIGRVSREAAEKTGLSAGTPVVAGGEDTSSAALALGIKDVGQSYMSTGTSTNIGVCIDRPIGVRNVMSFPHVIKDLRFLNGNISTTGRCLQWFREEMGSVGGSDISYEAMSEEAARSSVGANNLLFLPFLAGTFSPIPNTDARGVFCGISLNTARSDIIRSLMEGCAFELRHITDYLKDAGFPVSELRATGGPSKSDIWNQINCDVSGIPIVRVETLSDASVGDAMIAGVGTGVFADFNEAVEKTVRVGKRVDPLEKNRELYDQFYGLYRESYESLTGVFEKLARCSKNP